MLKENSLVLVNVVLRLCVYAEKCVDLIVLHIILNLIQTSEGGSFVAFPYPPSVIIFPI